MSAELFRRADRAKIKQITDAIQAVPGATLLDVDAGEDTNRTVVTLAGDPDGVAEAAFQAIATAARALDMRQHHGAHPRMGATDVCPFVPISGVGMDDCVAIARRVGERVGREMEVPLFLYEAAATRPERKNLATIRKGEYEGLAQKLQDPAWAPDFGPARFSDRAGATVVGAREFLIAYNVTLNTRDKALATDIAFELRERGRVARAATGSAFYSKGKILTYQAHVYPCGNCDFVGEAFEQTVRHCRDQHGYNLTELLRLNDVDPDEPLTGQKVYRAGRFRACRAIGWYVEMMQQGLKSTVAVPYRTAELSLAGIEAAAAVARHGNVNSITDAAVGAHIAFTGVQGGIWNVLINLTDIADAAFVQEMRVKCDLLVDDARKRLTEVTEYVEEQLRKLSHRETQPLAGVSGSS